MRLVTQLIPLALIALPPAIAATEQPGKAAAPLFHLSFDENFVADACGSGQPGRGSSQPDRIDGIAGQAARFSPGQSLSFQAKGNLHKPVGTLSFWLKLPGAGVKAGGAPVVLFGEKAPEKAGNARLQVELYPGRFIRLHLNDSRNSIVDYHGLANWEPDEWHHVAITWNNQKGGLFFVDGVPAGISWVRAWEPVAHDTFVIGSADTVAANATAFVLDELNIHDRELTPAEARAAFAKHRTPRATVLFQDPILPADVAGSIAVLLRNPGEQAIRLNNLRYTISGSANTTAPHEGQLPDTLLPGLGSSRLEIPIPAAPDGDYRVQLSYVEGGSEMSAGSSVRLVAARQPESHQPAKLSAITEIDATQQGPVAELGGTTVVTSPAGEYREGGSRVHDRFAMAFEIQDVNEPHVAVITYPDDKPRSMEILLQNFGKDIDFQVHSGVITGGEFPVSGTMREHRVLFWPRDRRQAFTFMTGEDGMPAAVAGITIHRLNQFPISTRKGEFSGSVPARRTGIYYEDPVLFHSFGTGTDLDGFTKAADRLVDYMQAFGQTEFEYPLAWYGGPLYGTGVEAFEPDITGGQGGLRPHPAGYPRYLMERLDEQGMRFTAGLHLHTLPSLDAYAITDWSRISADHDTVINVNKDGKLWYGYWHGSDLNYNPADPRVMGAVNAIVDEVLARYADHPALDAIALVISRTKIYSFGSLASGYNDSNLRRFQQESGLTMPVYEPGDAKRFAKSYEWIMANAEAKEAWINWRCQILYRHYADMADRIAAARPGLKLKLNVFVHPSQNHRLADYLRISSRDMMREMGIDPELFRNHPNVVINPTVVPADFRWMRRSDYLPDHPGVSRGAFTAPEVLAPLKDHANVRITIHDRYWEDAIGKEAPLKGLTDIGVQEMVWRASTLNPAGFNSLEPYVFALHHVDATEVIKGGYVLGTLGMERELEPFSRAFAALPATKFDDVAGAVDPVRIRQQIVDGRRYFYVLNTLPETVDVTVALAEDGVLLEPAEGQRHHVADTLDLHLEPYALHTFVSASTTQRVLGARVSVDASWLKDLEARYRALLAAADAAGGADFEHADYVAIARNAWQKRHYSRLYFLLQEVWAEELVGTAK